MIAQEKYEKGYSLPPGYAFENNKYPYGKTGIFYVVNKKNNSEIKAVLSYKSGKLNGICIFYENNEIKEKVPYKNNAIDGWALFYDNNKEKQRILYQEGIIKRKLELQDGLQDYWRESDVSTNSCLGVFKFDNNYHKNGIGYKFVNNSIQSVIEYQNDQEYRTLKEFDNNNMIEYDKNGEKIYEGGYENDLNKEYPRNGEGREYNGGMMLYLGDWINNKKEGNGRSFINGNVLYSGNWLNDIPDGEGRLMDEEGNMKYQGQWVKGQFFISGIDWYDYPSKTIIQKPIDNSMNNLNGTSIPINSLQSTPNINPLSSSMTSGQPQSIIYNQNGMDLSRPIDINSIPQNIPSSVIMTPANYPQAYVISSNNAYVIPSTMINQQGRIPSSMSMNQPVFVTADPMICQSGSTLPRATVKFNKKGDTKKKMIWLIVIVSIILLLLIAGIITLVWYNQAPTITISSIKELENLDWRVGALVIPTNSFNGFDDTSFIVKNFERLTKITIQDGSCKKVQTFLLNQLPALTSVIIGKECFNNEPNWGADITLDRSASAEVSDCKSLQILTVDAGSFVAYGGIKLNSILIL